jgi:hypothetical protein
MAFKMKGAPYSALKQGKERVATEKSEDESLDVYYARMRDLGHKVSEDGSVTFKK